MVKNKSRKVRALGICSGGLDSMLSGMILQQQGIEVQWLTFETPFFSSVKARRASAITGIPLEVENITPVYLKMLRNPPLGYGKYMNPCADCHTLMFQLAGKRMEAEHFDFLFSGEVLGQRPMSQTRPSLHYVEKHSGYKGYILRPLSAKRLPETIPEKTGLVDRSRLLDLAGRSRKPQIKLAREFGITEYPTPAGGCLLTDKGYSARLKDLFEHQDDCSETDLELLKIGRHFRIDPQTKIIVGRTQVENERLLKLRDPKRDITLTVDQYPSPLVLIPSGAESHAIQLAASLCAGYSKAPTDAPVGVQVSRGSSRDIIRVTAVPPATLSHLML